VSLDSRTHLPNHHRVRTASLFLILKPLCGLYTDAAISSQFGFGGLMVCMLAPGKQVRGFKAGRSRPIFRAKKSPACLPLEGVKQQSVPCRRFSACKKPLQFPWKLQCRLNLIGHFSPLIPPFADRGLSCRLTWSASGDDGGN
jgi:hypothetical protein